MSISFAQTQTLGGLDIELRSLISRKLPPKDVLSFCNSSRANQAICHSNIFWQALIDRDFPGQSEISEQLPGLAEKRQEQYKELYLARKDGFILIPGGKFQIGSPKTEAGRHINEDQREVELSPFWIMEAAVTQKDYARLTGKNPSLRRRKADCPDSFEELVVHEKKISVCSDFPVTGANWDEANEYAALKHKEDPSHEYSLASEAQFEVAMRGGTTTAYVCGEDPKCLSDYVWDGDKSHPVKSKLPNAYGFYRSSVWEWVNDGYLHRRSIPLIADSTAPPSDRVIRGGGWVHNGPHYRSARRDYAFHENRTVKIGFRLVRK